MSDASIFDTKARRDVARIEIGKRPKPIAVDNVPESSGWQPSRETGFALNRELSAISQR
jgi:hypothetical protein